MKRTFFVAAVVLVCALWAVRGWAGDGAVALQAADPSCADDFIQGKRYVNCENGTVTDNLTGLVWLANANCFGEMNWHEAMATVAGLGDLPDDKVCVDSSGTLSPDDCDCGLSDHSSPGEWRLATTGEWEAMYEHARDVLGCDRPTISDDVGNGCWSQACVDAGACSFYGFPTSSWYWTSSSYLPDPALAWDVHLIIGGINGGDKTDVDLHVWPVRGGQ